MSKDNRQNRGQPGSDHQARQPVEARVHVRKPAVDRIEPPLDAPQAFVYLIEGALDVGYAGLERVCVRNGPSSGVTALSIHAP